MFIGMEEESLKQFLQAPDIHIHVTAIQGERAIVSAFQIRKKASSGQVI